MRRKEQERAGQRSEEVYFWWMMALSHSAPTSESSWEGVEGLGIAGMTLTVKVFDEYQLNLGFR